MAVDEALLVSEDPRPTLRVYTWAPDALSLGYFQRWGDIHERHALSADSIVVRRLTGGGAIHHANELTFSIAAPASHPLYRGAVADSYRRVHDLVTRALADVDVPAELRGERSPIASDRAESNMCFHASTPLDLVWDDRKGVGSAQRRTGGRVLHHGSIKLGTTPLEGDVAQVHTRRPGVSALELSGLLVEAFGTAGYRQEPGTLTQAESEHAGSRAAHFRSRAHLERR